MLAFRLLVDLVEVDDVLVFHLGQDVDLFLDVLSGDAASRRHQPLLLDELGRILGARALLDDAVHGRELAAEIKKIIKGYMVLIAIGVGRG